METIEITRLYWDELPETEKKISLLRGHKRGLMFTATGYGSKIPTDKMIKYNNRWHRVYCRIYSNIGSCYINTKTKKIYID